MKFRRKPLEIEAVQWFPGKHVEDVCEIPCPKCNKRQQEFIDVPHIHTLEGIMGVQSGDWIITGVKGEKYACKPDIFDMTYEPVEEPKDKLAMPLKITSVTLGVGRRCPTCHELPYEFRRAFTRRVEWLHIVPKKSQHLSQHADGTVFEYKPSPDCISPEGKYPSVIVPERLIGKIILIKEEDDNDRRIEAEEKARKGTVM